MASLSQLLARVRSADPSMRMDYRDEVAAHGLAAIDGVKQMFAEHEFASFAVGVTEHVGKESEHRAAAVEALRAALSIVSPDRTADVAAALARLGVKAPAPSTGTSQDADLARLHRPGGLPAEAGIYWPGFQMHDFGRNAGSSWRSRDGKKSLAPIIVRLLRAQHASFSSYGVNRLPHVHFFLPQRYRWAGDHKSGWRASKLVVYAHGPTGENPSAKEEVVGGWYIEKSDGGAQFGPLDDRWDWPWFVRALRRPTFQTALTVAMSEHVLQIGDYPGDWFESGQAVGGVGNIVGGKLVFERTDGGKIVGWAAFADHLASLPIQTWHNLHIWRTWDAVDAVAAGREFATQALGPVLRDLARVYLMVVQEALPTGDENYRVVERRADGTPASIEFATYARGVPVTVHVPAAILRELGIGSDGQVILKVSSEEGIHNAGPLRLAAGNLAHLPADDRLEALILKNSRALLRVLLQKPSRGEDGEA